MSVPVKDTMEVYKKITRSNEVGGSYRKTCFHVHTPASYDYKLRKEWENKDFINATEEDLFEICISNHALPSTWKLEDVPVKATVYCSQKEHLAYLLLAKAIITNQIEIVLIADHHTIEGYKKLNEAIEELSNQNIPYHPMVILGIEISCADKNHVVGIFDNKESTINSINRWLDYHLISKEDGSFETSATVLEFIKKNNGIGYIAHIDHSDILKANQFSNGFKKKLFSDDVLSIVGIKDRFKKEELCKKINEYRNKHAVSLKVVLDNDAHDIDSISNNCFWMKGKNSGFSMLKEAIADYDISVTFERESSPTQYIKGLYIQRTDIGFLSGKEDSDFCLLFSNALNCFIGGRGSGKSSVLELLEFILRQQCHSEDQLEFNCAHGTTWILYVYNGDEYMLRMWMPKKQYQDSILCCFGQNPAHLYRYSYSFDPQRIREHILKNNFSVFKVVKQGKEINLERVSSLSVIRELTNNFFDMRYSVNDLVNTASGDDINQFISAMLYRNNTIFKQSININLRSISGLKKEISNLQNRLTERKREVDKVVNAFNAEQEKKLRIVYSQNGQIAPDFLAWLFAGNASPKHWYNHFNISNEDLCDYLSSLLSKKGLFDFLSILIDGKVKEAIKIENILSYCSELTQKMIDNGVTKLDSQSAEAMLLDVFKRLLSNDRLDFVKKTLKSYISNIEKFSLEFNINNIEGSNGQTIYKPVRVLSLGQKVVAMLSFVLGFSEYAHDYRPLLIDQPEDNLDNRYIYQNLVKQLRSIKEKRQVIIATHNATIVTNAKADQVCVMESNSQHGWVKATGYPSEEKIKKYIINYLEGGVPSFIHKMSVYEPVLIKGK